MSELLYLSRHDVESLQLGMAEIIDLVASALSERGQGRAEMPPKPSLHPGPGALLQAMPAYVPRSQACGIKWVSAYSTNKERGLPSVAALMILNDPATGLPQCIMDATWITAMRTGAATAVAARLLARPDAQVLGLLGPGVQGRTNLAALKQVLPRLQRVRAYGPNRQTLLRYQQEMEREHKIEVEAAASPETALRGADVVVTAAPWPSSSSAPPVKAEWLKAGVFACALDFDASFSTAAVAHFTRAACDDAATFEYYRGQGSFSGWPATEELAAIVTGKRPGRTQAQERILLVSLGLAIYDVVVGRRLLQIARERRIGQILSS